MPSIILAAHGRITSRHGQNIGRGFPHRGIDQGHNNGTAYDLEIRAPADGIVTFADHFGSYGLCMFITHRDGWVTVLAHHAKHLVRKGAWVKQGQLLAVMGNTGTKYVHSHQELRDNTSRQLDPLKHLVVATVAAETSTLIPAIAEEEDEEMILFQGKGDAKIYELRGGKKRHISADEYAVLKAAKVPVRRNIPAASVAKIPNA